MTENNIILKNIFEKMLKINNNSTQCYYYKIIYLTQIIIIALINFDNNNIFISIFHDEDNNTSKSQNALNKLFLLHVAISYRNTFSKLSKFLPNDKNLFSLIYTQIFFIPFLHNFDKVIKIISKKIDLVLFGNSEYISSLVFDLENKNIIYDTGYSVQKNYKTSFLDFSKKNKILDEINFFGKKLKNNYFKSGDKNLDKIDNCIKLEFRATFPKPLFILRFFPILKGVLIVHVFHQYKLSKVQMANPLSNEEYIYERYKEIDAVFFDFFNKLEEYNSKNMINIEKFFFEYFFLLGNNIKEIGKNMGNINKNLMTYKSKDFDVIYLNKQILQIIKDSIGQYYLNNKENKKENDLIYKLKKRLGDEYEKYKNENNNINNTNTFLEDLQIKNEKKNANRDATDNLNINEYIYNTNLNNLTKTKNILEFNFINFIHEFDLSKIFPNNVKIKSDNEDNQNNDDIIINTSEINVQFPSEYSNVNEYSNLNLTKDNIDLIKRNIITSATRTNLISKTASKTNSNTNRNFNNKELNMNIYDNYRIFNTEKKNVKTEEEKEEIKESEEPFKIDITSIQKNIIGSKDESELNSILTEKEKNF